MDVTGALKSALVGIKQLNITGSTTACLVSMNQQAKVLTVSNLGDSGAVIFRPKNTSPFFDILFETIPMCHRFNAPFQLGHYLEVDPSNSSIVTDHQYDEPASATCSYIPIQQNDIILLGTDGLFDNVFMHEITDILKNIAPVIMDISNETSGAALLRRKELEELIETAVKDLGLFALNQSLDENRASPFAIAASAERTRILRARGLLPPTPVGDTDSVYDGYLGGKPDDITIILAVVGPELTNEGG